MDSSVATIGKSFPFLLPTRIQFGLGAAKQVAEETLAFGKRALIVTDPGVWKAGLVESMQQALIEAGIATAVFADVEANPHTETVDAAASAAADLKAEVIIAIGGGSALDTAKAAAAVFTWGGPVTRYEGLEVVPGPTTPVIAIPTTAGTGSEVTLWAIITDRVRHFKMPIGSFHLAPRVALVDPELTFTLPALLTASTGMDALTHAIEAYTARCANPLSDALCLSAIELITCFLEKAVADGADQEARCALMLGSLMAGVAFGNSDTAAVHSMAEAMGGALDVPHGIANAICLPYVTAHNASAEQAKTACIGRAMGLGTAGLTEAEASGAAVEALFALVGRLAIPTMRSVGVTEAHIPELVQLAMMNSGTPDNPVAMDEQAFRTLFLAALGDSKETSPTSP